MLWAYNIDKAAAIPELLRHKTIKNPRGRLPAVSGQIAILPVHGTISQRGEFFGTSTMGLDAAFEKAINSSNIEAIILDVDSPGGTTAGVQTTAENIFSARGIKPVVALANSEAASAALWIASAADVFAVAPGGQAGSIGVFRVHEDITQALAEEGIKITMLRMPEAKAEGAPFLPLTEEAIQHNMEQIGLTFSRFSGDVARHRNVTPRAAQQNFGQGRMMEASQALEAGLVDRVISFADLFAELRGGVPKNKRLSASADWDTQRELCRAYKAARPQGRAKFPARKRLAERRLAELER